MKKSLIFTMVVSSVFAQDMKAGVQISGAPGAYSINTADYYSWQTRTKVFAFQHTTVSEITHILKGCLSTYGKIQINDQMNMVIITEESNKLQNILDLCAKLDVENMKGFVKVKTESIPTSFELPSKLAPYLESSLSIDGFIEAHDAINLLVVHDHADVISRIKNDIVKYDAAPKEIRLDFDIVEILNDDFKDNGVNWDELFSVVNASASFNYSRDNSVSDNSSNSSTVSSPSTTPSSDSRTTSSDNDGDRSAFNGGASINMSNFKKFLRVMVENGSANYVSNNSLSVINNQTTVFEYTYAGKSVLVKVKPNILNAEMVRLNLELVIDGKAMYESVIHAKLGEIKKVVSFQNSDTTISSKRVPGLGSILPFIFSRKAKGKEDLKLEIVVTASLK